MRYILSFAKFWYDFIIGDDWTIAASIAAAVAGTFWLVHSNIEAWWLLPLTAIVTLGVSLWRDA
jgi:hypothetical protein